MDYNILMVAAEVQGFERRIVRAAAEVQGMWVKKGLFVLPLPISRPLWPSRQRCGFGRSIWVWTLEGIQCASIGQSQ